MQFFKSVQDSVFSVLAPMQSPEAQLELAVSQGSVPDFQRLCGEHRHLDPAVLRTSSQGTLLEVACGSGKLDMFNYLRTNHSFDVAAINPTTGDSLLHCAARSGNLELVKLLVNDAGLSASHRNKARRNPYDVANDTVGAIKQFLLPHVFAGEQKDGSAPKLPHWLEETKSRGAPGAAPVYAGPPPPTGPAPGGRPGYGQPRGTAADQPYQLPNAYDGFGTSEVRQVGRGGPRMPTGPPPPTAFQGGAPAEAPGAQPGAGSGAVSGPGYGQQVQPGYSPHLRRAYVPFNSQTGVGQAYTAAQPTMGRGPPAPQGADGGVGTADGVGYQQRPGMYSARPGGPARGAMPTLFTPTPMPAQQPVQTVQQPLQGQPMLGPQQPTYGYQQRPQQQQPQPQYQQGAPYRPQPSQQAASPYYRG